MAALERLTPLVAHGGTAGAIVEGGLAVTVALIFLAVWLRERRARSRAEDER